MEEKETKNILVVAQSAADAYHEDHCASRYCYDDPGEKEPKGTWDNPNTLITVRCNGEFKWDNNETDEKRILRAFKTARMYKTKYPDKEVIIDFYGTFVL